jgi:fructose-1-phosphate kinase PfkB-like protein/lipopolysaccharide/colanic/teichoic acid biosynthesis glycosyltransferase/Ser/Thr protein kinase RdoA (MazF antagonist)/mannose-6-phosphate isomerase-like protein (cupin superfamily)
MAVISIGMMWILSKTLVDFEFEIVPLGTLLQRFYHSAKHFFGILGAANLLSVATSSLTTEGFSPLTGGAGFLGLGVPLMALGLVDLMKQRSPPLGPSDRKPAINDGMSRSQKPHVPPPWARRLLPVFIPLLLVPVLSLLVSDSAYAFHVPLIALPFVTQAAGQTGDVASWSGRVLATIQQVLAQQRGDLTDLFASPLFLALTGATLVGVGVFVLLWTFTRDDDGNRELDRWRPPHGTLVLLIGMSAAIGSGVGLVAAEIVPWVNGGLLGLGVGALVFGQVTRKALRVSPELDQRHGVLFFLLSTVSYWLIGAGAFVWASVQALLSVYSIPTPFPYDLFTMSFILGVVFGLGWLFAALADTETDDPPRPRFFTLAPFVLGGVLSAQLGTSFFEQALSLFGAAAQAAEGVPLLPLILLIVEGILAFIALVGLLSRSRIGGIALGALGVLVSLSGLWLFFSGLVAPESGNGAITLPSPAPLATQMSTPAPLIPGTPIPTQISIPTSEFLLLGTLCVVVVIGLLVGLRFWRLRKGAINPSEEAEVATGLRKGRRALGQVALHLPRVWPSRTDPSSGRLRELHQTELEAHAQLLAAERKEQLLRKRRETELRAANSDGRLVVLFMVILAIGIIGIISLLFASGFDFLLKWFSRFFDALLGSGINLGNLSNSSMPILKSGLGLQVLATGAPKLASLGSDPELVIQELPLMGGGAVGLGTADAFFPLVQWLGRWFEAMGMALGILGGVGLLVQQRSKVQFDAEFDAGRGEVTIETGGRSQPGPGRSSGLVRRLILPLMAISAAALSLALPSVVHAAGHSLGLPASEAALPLIHAIQWLAGALGAGAVILGVVDAGSDSGPSPLMSPTIIAVTIALLVFVALGRWRASFGWRVVGAGAAAVGMVALTAALDPHAAQALIDRWTAWMAGLATSLMPPSASSGLVSALSGAFTFVLTIELLRMAQLGSVRRKLLTAGLAALLAAGAALALPLTPIQAAVFAPLLAWAIGFMLALGLTRLVDVWTPAVKVLVAAIASLVGVSLVFSLYWILLSLTMIVTAVLLSRLFEEVLGMQLPVAVMRAVSVTVGGTLAAVGGVWVLERFLVLFEQTHGWILYVPVGLVGFVVGTYLVQRVRGKLRRLLGLEPSEPDPSTGSSSGTSGPVSSDEPTSKSKRYDSRLGRFLYEQGIEHGQIGWRWLYHVFSLWIYRHERGHEQAARRLGLLGEDFQPHQLWEGRVSIERGPPEAETRTRRAGPLANLRWLIATGASSALLAVLRDRLLADPTTPSLLPLLLGIAALAVLLTAVVPNLALVVDALLPGGEFRAAPQERTQAWRGGTGSLSFGSSSRATLAEAVETLLAEQEALWEVLWQVEGENVAVQYQTTVKLFMRQRPKVEMVVALEGLLRSRNPNWRLTQEMQRALGDLEASSPLDVTPRAIAQALRGPLGEPTAADQAIAEAWQAQFFSRSAVQDELFWLARLGLLERWRDEKQPGRPYVYGFTQAWRKILRHPDTRRILRAFVRQHLVHPHLGALSEEDLRALRKRLEDIQLQRWPPRTALRKAMQRFLEKPRLGWKARETVARTRGLDRLTRLGLLSRQSAGVGSAVYTLQPDWAAWLQNKTIQDAFFARLPQVEVWPLDDLRDLRAARRWLVMARWDYGEKVVAGMGDWEEVRRRLGELVAQADGAPVEAVVTFREREKIPPEFFQARERHLVDLVNNSLADTPEQVLEVIDQMGVPWPDEGDRIQPKLPVGQARTSLLEWFTERLQPLVQLGESLAMTLDPTARQLDADRVAAINQAFADYHKAHGPRAPDDEEPLSDEERPLPDDLSPDLLIAAVHWRWFRLANAFAHEAAQHLELVLPALRMTSDLETLEDVRWVIFNLLRTTNGLRWTTPGIVVSHPPRPGVLAADAPRQYAGALPAVVHDQNLVASLFGSIYLYSPERVIPHERIEEELRRRDAASLFQRIKLGGRWFSQVFVTRAADPYVVIRDGTHRWDVARELGLAWLPIQMVAEEEFNVGRWDGVVPGLTEELLQTFAAKAGVSLVPLAMPQPIDGYTGPPLGRICLRGPDGDRWFAVGDPKAVTLLRDRQTRQVEEGLRLWDLLFRAGLEQFIRRTGASDKHRLFDRKTADFWLASEQKHSGQSTVALLLRPMNTNAAINRVAETGQDHGTRADAHEFDRRTFGLVFLLDTLRSGLGLSDRALQATLQRELQQGYRLVDLGPERPVDGRQYPETLYAFEPIPGASWSLTQPDLALAYLENLFPYSYGAPLHIAERPAPVAAPPAATDQAASAAALDLHALLTEFAKTLAEAQRVSEKYAEQWPLSGNTGVDEPADEILHRAEQVLHEFEDALPANSLARYTMQSMLRLDRLRQSIEDLRSGVDRRLPSDELRTLVAGVTHAVSFTLMTVRFLPGAKRLDHLVASLLRAARERGELCMISGQTVQVVGEVAGTSEVTDVDGPNMSFVAQAADGGTTYLVRGGLLGRSRERLEEIQQSTGPDEVSMVDGIRVADDGIVMWPYEGGFLDLGDGLLLPYTEVESVDDVRLAPSMYSDEPVALLSNYRIRLADGRYAYWGGHHHHALIWAAMARRDGAVPPGPWAVRTFDYHLDGTPVPLVTRERLINASGDLTALAHSVVSGLRVNNVLDGAMALGFLDPARSGLWGKGGAQHWKRYKITQPANFFGALTQAYDMTGDEVDRLLASKTFVADIDLDVLKADPELTSVREAAQDAAVFLLCTSPYNDGGFVDQALAIAAGIRLLRGVSAQAPSSGGSAGSASSAKAVPDTSLAAPPAARRLASLLIAFFAIASIAAAPATPSGAGGIDHLRLVVGILLLGLALLPVVYIVLVAFRGGKRVGEKLLVSTALTSILFVIELALLDPLRPSTEFLLVLRVHFPIVFRFLRHLNLVSAAAGMLLGGIFLGLGDKNIQPSAAWITRHPDGVLRPLIEVRVQSWARRLLGLIPLMAISAAALSLALPGVAHAAGLSLGLPASHAALPLVLEPTSVASNPLAPGLLESPGFNWLSIAALLFCSWVVMVVLTVWLRVLLLSLRRQVRGEQDQEKKAAVQGMLRFIAWAMVVEVIGPVVACLGIWALSTLIALSDPGMGQFLTHARAIASQIHVDWFTAAASVGMFCLWLWYEYTEHERKNPLPGVSSKWEQANQGRATAQHDQASMSYKIVLTLGLVFIGMALYFAFRDAFRELLFSPSSGGALGGTLVMVLPIFASGLMPRSPSHSHAAAEEWFYQNPLEITLTQEELEELRQQAERSRRAGEQFDQWRTRHPDGVLRSLIEVRIQSLAQRLRGPLLLLPLVLLGSLVLAVGPAHAAQTLSVPLLIPTWLKELFLIMTTASIVVAMSRMKSNQQKRRSPQRKPAATGVVIPGKEPRAGSPRSRIANALSMVPLVGVHGLLMPSQESWPAMPFGAAGGALGSASQHGSGLVVIAERLLHEVAGWLGSADVSVLVQLLLGAFVAMTLFNVGSSIWSWWKGRGLSSRDVRYARTPTRSVLEAIKWGAATMSLLGAIPLGLWSNSIWVSLAALTAAVTAIPSRWLGKDESRRTTMSMSRRIMSSRVRIVGILSFVGLGMAMSALALQFEPAGLTVLESFGVLDRVSLLGSTLRNVLGDQALLSSLKAAAPWMIVSWIIHTPLHELLHAVVLLLLGERVAAIQIARNPLAWLGLDAARIQMRAALDPLRSTLVALVPNALLMFLGTAFLWIGVMGYWVAALEQYSIFMWIGLLHWIAWIGRFLIRAVRPRATGDFFQAAAWWLGVLLLLVVQIGDVSIFSVGENRNVPNFTQFIAVISAGLVVGMAAHKGRASLPEEPMPRRPTDRLVRVTLFVLSLLVSAAIVVADLWFIQHASVIYPHYADLYADIGPFAFDMVSGFVMVFLLMLSWRVATSNWGVVRQAVFQLAIGLGLGSVMATYSDFIAHGYVSNYLLLSIGGWIVATRLPDLTMVLFVLLMLEVFDPSRGSPRTIVSDVFIRLVSIMVFAHARVIVGIGNWDLVARGLIIVSSFVVIVAPRLVRLFVGKLWHGLRRHVRGDPRLLAILALAATLLMPRPVFGAWQPHTPSDNTAPVATQVGDLSVSMEPIPPTLSPTPIPPVEPRTPGSSNDAPIIHELVRRGFSQEQAATFVREQRLAIRRMAPHWTEEQITEQLYKTYPHTFWMLWRHDSVTWLMFLMLIGVGIVREGLTALRVWVTQGKISRRRLLALTGRSVLRLVVVATVVTWMFRLGPTTAGYFDRFSGNRFINLDDPRGAWQAMVSHETSHLVWPSSDHRLSYAVGYLRARELGLAYGLTRPEATPGQLDLLSGSERQSGYDVAQRAWSFGQEVGDPERAWDYLRRVAELMAEGKTLEEAEAIVQSQGALPRPRHAAFRTPSRFISVGLKLLLPLVLLGSLVLAVGPAHAAQTLSVPLLIPTWLKELFLIMTTASIVVAMSRMKSNQPKRRSPQRKPAATSAPTDQDLARALSLIPALLKKNPRRLPVLAAHPDVARLLPDEKQLSAALGQLESSGRIVQVTTKHYPETVVVLGEWLDRLAQRLVHEVPANRRDDPISQVPLSDAYELYQDVYLGKVPPDQHLLFFKIFMLAWERALLLGILVFLGGYLYQVPEQSIMVNPKTKRLMLVSAFGSNLSARVWLVVFRDAWRTMWTWMRLAFRAAPDGPVPQDAVEFVHTLEQTTWKDEASLVLWLREVVEAFNEKFPEEQRQFAAALLGAFEERKRRGKLTQIGYQVSAGGKATNSARVLAMLGVREIPWVGFVGQGPLGWRFDALLPEAIQAHPIGTVQDTRAYIGLYSEPDIRLKTPGQQIADEEWTAFRMAYVELLAEAAGGQWVMMGGSVPAGAIPESVYAWLIQEAKTRNLRVVLNVHETWSPERLRTALEAQPTMLKFNREEFHHTLNIVEPDRPVDVSALSPAEIGELAKRLASSFGIELVMVSLDKDGVVLAANHRGQPVAYHARYNGTLELRTTMGAGDALTAGFIHALGQGTPLDQALRKGVAVATALVQWDGTASWEPERFLSEVGLSDAEPAYAYPTTVGPPIAVVLNPSIDLLLDHRLPTAPSSSASRELLESSSRVTFAQAGIELPDEEALTSLREHIAAERSRPRLTIGRIVALLLLPLAVIVIAGLAVVVKLSSPGPVFYRKPAVVIGGKPLTVVKLRTMTPDGRITWAGRWLRPLGLDEIPQIVSMITGEMVWFGPRPIHVKYERLFASYIEALMLHTRGRIRWGMFSTNLLTRGFGTFRPTRDHLGVLLVQRFLDDREDFENQSAWYNTRLLLRTAAAFMAAVASVVPIKWKRIIQWAILAAVSFLLTSSFAWMEGTEPTDVSTLGRWLVVGMLVIATWLFLVFPLVAREKGPRWGMVFAGVSFALLAAVGYWLLPPVSDASGIEFLLYLLFHGALYAFGWMLWQARQRVLGGLTLVGGTLGLALLPVTVVQQIPPWMGWSLLSQIILAILLAAGVGFYLVRHARQRRPSSKPAAANHVFSSSKAPMLDRDRDQSTVLTVYANDGVDPYRVRAAPSGEIQWETSPSSRPARRVSQVALRWLSVVIWLVRTAFRLDPVTPETKRPSLRVHGQDHFALIPVRRGRWVSIRTSEAAAQERLRIIQILTVLLRPFGWSVRSSRGKTAIDIFPIGSDKGHARDELLAESYQLVVVDDALKPGGNGEPYIRRPFLADLRDPKFLALSVAEPDPTLPPAVGELGQGLAATEAFLEALVHYGRQGQSPLQGLRSALAERGVSSTAISQLDTWDPERRIMLAFDHDLTLNESAGRPVAPRVAQFLAQAWRLGYDIAVITANAKIKMMEGGLLDPVFKAGASVIVEEPLTVSPGPDVPAPLTEEELFEIAEAVFAQYDLGKVIRIEPLGELVKQWSAGVETTQGTYALTRHFVHHTPARMRELASRLERLRQAGFPEISQMLETRGGEPYVELDEEMYAVYPLLQGRPLEPGAVRGGPLRRIAKWLARYHQAQRVPDSELSERSDFWVMHAIPASLQRAANRLKREAPSTLTRAEQFFLEHYEEVLVAIRSAQRALTADVYQRLPKARIHGDVWAGNFLFDERGQGLIGVIDWDDMSRDARIVDLVDGIVPGFPGVEIPELRRFLEDYQEEALALGSPLSAEEVRAIPQILTIRIVIILNQLARSATLNQVGNSEEKLAFYQSALTHLQNLTTKDWYTALAGIGTAAPAPPERDVRPREEARPARPRQRLLEVLVKRFRTGAFTLAVWLVAKRQRAFAEPAFVQYADVTHEQSFQSVIASLWDELRQVRALRNTLVELYHQGDTAGAQAVFQAYERKRQATIDWASRQLARVLGGEDLTWLQRVDNNVGRMNHLELARIRRLAQLAEIYYTPDGAIEPEVKYYVDGTDFAMVDFATLRPQERRYVPMPGVAFMKQGDEVVPSGFTEPIHIHTEYAERLAVLQGELIFTYFDDDGRPEDLTLRPGEFVFIHPNLVHTLRNPSDKVLHVTAIKSPYHTADRLQFRPATPDRHNMDVSQEAYAQAHPHRVPVEVHRMEAVSGLPLRKLDIRFRQEGQTFTAWLGSLEPGQSVTLEAVAMGYSSLVQPLGGSLDFLVNGRWHHVEDRQWSGFAGKHALLIRNRGRHSVGVYILTAQTEEPSVTTGRFQPKPWKGLFSSVRSLYLWGLQDLKDTLERHPEWSWVEQLGATSQFIERYEFSWDYLIGALLFPRKPVERLAGKGRAPHGEAEWQPATRTRPLLSFAEATSAAMQQQTATVARETVEELSAQYPDEARATIFLVFGSVAEGWALPGTDIDLNLFVTGHPNPSYLDALTGLLHRKCVAAGLQCSAQAAIVSGYSSSPGGLEHRCYMRRMRRHLPPWSVRRRTLWRDGPSLSGTGDTSSSS